MTNALSLAASYITAAAGPTCRRLTNRLGAFGGVAHGLHRVMTNNVNKTFITLNIRVTITAMAERVPIETPFPPLPHACHVTGERIKLAGRELARFAPLLMKTDALSPCRNICIRKKRSETLFVSTSACIRLKVAASPDKCT